MVGTGTGNPAGEGLSVMQQMWRLVGIIIFSMAFGMILTVLISNRLVGLIVAAILMLVSYNLIFCEK